MSVTATSRPFKPSPLPEQFFSSVPIKNSEAKGLEGSEGVLPLEVIEHAGVTLKEISDRYGPEVAYLMCGRQELRDLVNEVNYTPTALHVFTEGVTISSNGTAYFPEEAGERVVQAFLKLNGDDWASLGRSNSEFHQLVELTPPIDHIMAPDLKDDSMPLHHVVKVNDPITTAGLESPSADLTRTPSGQRIDAEPDDNSDLRIPANAIPAGARGTRAAQFDIPAAGTVGRAEEHLDDEMTRLAWDQAQTLAQNNYKQAQAFASQGSLDVPQFGVKVLHDAEYNPEFATLNTGLEREGTMQEVILKIMFETILSKYPDGAEIKMSDITDRYRPVLLHPGGENSPTRLILLDKDTDEYVVLTKKPFDSLNDYDVGNFDRGFVSFERDGDMYVRSLTDPRDYGFRIGRRQLIYPRGYYEDRVSRRELQEARPQNKIN